MNGIPEDSAPSSVPLRQPKKRFVGRRTADAQAQKDAPTAQNVETTSIQKGQYPSISQHYMRSQLHHQLPNKLTL